MAATSTRGHTREEFVTAALEFIQQEGFAALSLRSLGEHMGVHATTVYRHFPTKADLIAGLGDSLFEQIYARFQSRARSPRKRVIDLALTVAEVFSENPQLAHAAMHNTVPPTKGLTLTHLVLVELEAMGLRGKNLVSCYQMLESYVIGTSLYNVASAPAHLESRQFRYRAYLRPEFDAASRDASQIEKLNLESFTDGLEALLDRCESLASA